jgi:hypothetical protein
MALGVDPTLVRKEMTSWREDKQATFQARGKQANYKNIPFWATSEGSPMVRPSVRDSESWSFWVFVQIIG